MLGGCVGWWQRQRQPAELQFHTDGQRPAYEPAGSADPNSSMFQNADATPFEYEEDATNAFAK